MTWKAPVVTASCARRSDDTDARKATVARFGRSDRRAPGDRPLLRSITTKRASYCDLPLENGAGGLG
jgi:hypothetical protein